MTTRRAAVPILLPMSDKMNAFNADSGFPTVKHGSLFHALTSTHKTLPCNGIRSVRFNTRSADVYFFLNVCHGRPKGPHEY